MDAVNNNGGVPVLIPYCQDLQDQYLELCDGFIFPGGEYDIHPSYYGEEIIPETNVSNDVRTNFEISMMHKVLDRDKPMIAICAGQQLLNVISGGTLYQDIDKDLKSSIKHRHEYAQNTDWHDVQFKSGTKLREIVGVDSYKTNSHHHQAVKKVGKNLLVNAVAADGVIEGIEHPDKNFCIGLEWHPEHEQNVYDTKIFKAFIKAASE